MKTEVGLGRQAPGFQFQMKEEEQLRDCVM